MTLLLRPAFNIFACVLLISALILSGCEKATDPDDEGNGPKTVALSEITDLPKLGGRYTDVEVLDNGIVAIVDGKIILFDLNFENEQVISDEAIHDALGAKDAAHVYAITSNKEIRTYNLSTKAFTTSPYSIQYNLSDAEFRFNSKDEPYVVITHGSSRGVVYYSKDKGTTWTLLPPAPAAPAAFDITFDPNDNPLFVSPSGLYRTTDDGANWTLLTADQPNFQGLRGFTTNDGTIYVYIKGVGGLMKSVNGGTSFTTITTDPTLNVISMLEGDDGALYAIIGLSAAGFNFENTMSELKRSTDGGATWKHLLFCNSSAFSIRNGHIVVLNGGMFVQAMNISQGGAFISGDNGATWQSRGTTTVESVSGMGLSPSGEIYLLAESTLFKRVGNHWETLGMNRGRFGSFAIGKDNKIFLTSSSTGDLFDPSSGSVVRSAFDYPINLGVPTVLKTLGLHGGGYLVAIGFYYNFHYPSGAVVRVDANGIVQPNGSTSFGLQNVVENPDGLLYGTSIFEVGIGQQFESELYVSGDGGKTWELSPTQEFAPLAFSNTHVLQRKGESFMIGPYASLTGKEFTLDGFIWNNERPAQFFLTNDNRLYMLSLNTTNAVTRILYTTTPIG